MTEMKQDLIIWMPNGYTLKFENVKKLVKDETTLILSMAEWLPGKLVMPGSFMTTLPVGLCHVM
ncbi:hypothetical protein [Lacticaseibacillus manihotivorans]|uniref:hypothetical protein n=1 Tax=Lacticaseibacillus manihotivorans TaxID=88233 RepID=UPI0006D125D0|nr:hypothetical protein [Lacticaseibacillus manihotivorans]